MEIKRTLDIGANCSTIIVGKNVSTTGRVLVGHNEDDPRGLTATYLVPRKKHEKGETLTFDDGSAVIPEVEETYAYIWSEVREPGGEPFADAFYNEWGLFVCSNSAEVCQGQGEDLPEPLGGLGYGLRRLVAERAKSAREAVEVIADLVETYGYYSARTYNVIDKDEGWVVQIPPGHNFAAQRVPDDEVYYMPNWLTIRQIDFSDKEHKEFYWSKNVVGYAIEKGYYTPAVEGDYSDFDFAKAYQKKWDEKYNWERADTAWPMLLGHEPSNLRAFSEKPDGKIGPELIKKVLASHFDGKPYDASCGGTKSPHALGHFAVCNCMTLESDIVLFDEDPRLTMIYRSIPRPCAAPYTPWFGGITELPAGYNWMDEETAKRTHFLVTDRDFKYDPSMPYWVYQTLYYLTEANYAFNHKPVEESARKLEEGWEAETAALTETARELMKTDEKTALGLLTAFTAAKCQEGHDWAFRMIREIGERQLDENIDWDDHGDTELMPEEVWTK